MDPIKDFDKWIENLDEAYWLYTWRNKIEDEEEEKFIAPTAKEIALARGIYGDICYEPNCRYIYTIDNEFCFIKSVDTGSHHLTIVKGGECVNYLFLPSGAGKSVNVFARVPYETMKSNTKLQEIITLFLS